jgi:hypothetical protein
MSTRDARSHLGVVCTGLWLKYVQAGAPSKGARRQVREKRFPRQLSLDGNQRRARAARLAPSMQDNNTESKRALDFTKLLQIIAACDPSATSVRVSQMLRICLIIGRGFIR